MSLWVTAALEWAAFLMGWLTCAILVAGRVAERNGRLAMVRDSLRASERKYRECLERCERLERERGE